MTLLNYISPKMADKFREAGITRKPFMYWIYLIQEKKWILRPSMVLGQKACRAYTLAELGMMIPWGFLQAPVVHKMPGNYWLVKLSNGKSIPHATEVDARAEYLLDLLSSGNTTLDQVNHFDKIIIKN